MIEPQTVSEAVRIIYHATHNTDVNARVAFDQLLERVLDRNLNDMERERGWYEFLAMFIQD